MRKSAHQVRVRHAIDMEMLGIKVKAGYDPDQPRNPHTGEWMDTASGIFGEIDSALTGLADDVLGQMEGLHSWPKGEPLKLTQIRTSDGGWADLEGNEIQVSKGVAGLGGHSEANQALTLAHEMGHFLDHRLKKNHNRFLSDAPSSPAMQAFVASCVHSSTWDTIRQDRYMSDPSELWARAYAQWVRTKADKDSVIKGDVGRGGGHPEGWMWPDDEFGPIAAAVEAVLGEQGLV